MIAYSTFILRLYCIELLESQESTQDDRNQEIKDLEQLIPDIDAKVRNTKTVYIKKTMPYSSFKKVAKVL